MSSMHANPFDSVNIFLDTKCQKALGMHWGTVSRSPSLYLFFFFPPHFMFHLAPG